YADEVLHGFGVRPYIWHVDAEATHQLTQALSMSAGYYRNWYGNFLVTDNLAVSPGDFSQYCVTAPSDSRLPGGGGYPVCGLYDVNPAKFGQFAFVVTRDDRLKEVYNGFDASVDVRMPRGFNVSGGFNMGRTETNNCDVVLNNPQFGFGGPTAAATIPPTNTAPRATAYCDVVPPWSADTQVK